MPWDCYSKPVENERFDEILHVTHYAKAFLLLS